MMAHFQLLPLSNLEMCVRYIIHSYYLLSVKIHIGYYPKIHVCRLHPLLVTGLLYYSVILLSYV